MGWRFRQSFRLIPGVRLNLSKSGLSCSVGGAPFTVNVGKRGIYGTASLPGPGISFKLRFAGESDTSHEPDSLPFPASIPLIPAAPLEEVHSARTELTSESLKDLKQVIQTAHEEHDDISGQLDKAQNEKQRAFKRYSSWDGGFLFPDELYQTPRNWAERAYPNLIHYNKVEKGGHFAAWEQPQIFSEEVRTGFRSLRKIAIAA
jgi:pimeloyl-ACP methyl ester carboxylesterase